MRINLWHSPYNGGWIWFDRANLRRFEWGRSNVTDSRSTKGTIWWAILGFSGSIQIQTRPWQKPRLAFPVEVLCYWRDGRCERREFEAWPQRTELPDDAVRFDIAWPDRER